MEEGIILSVQMHGKPNLNNISNLNKVLLDTKKAKLLHFVRGSEPEVDLLLMELRKNISN